MNRSQILTAAVTALDWSGLTLLLRPLYGGLGCILALHRVIPDQDEALLAGNAVTRSQLRTILSYLSSSNVDLVSLSEIPARLAQPSHRRFVAITLDDGYRDNLEVGLPVFEEFNAPFTVFPATGFISRSHIHWIYLWEKVCLERDQVQWRIPGNDVVERQRQDGESRLLFFQRTMAELESPGLNLDETVREAFERMGFDLQAYQEELYLSWEQLRQLAWHRLASVGAHTVTHKALGKLEAKEAEWEMATAKAELTQRLERPIDHIAYPFGSPGMCGEREFEMARTLGFKTGLITRRGNIREQDRKQLWALPRHTLSMAAHSRSIGYLRLSMNGVWDSPLNGLLFRR